MTADGSVEEIIKVYNVFERADHNKVRQNPKEYPSTSATLSVDRPRTAESNERSAAVHRNFEISACLEGRADHENSWSVL